MIISSLKRIALSLAFFVAVYAPAFAIAALLRPSIAFAIPLVIVISAAMACFIIALRARVDGGIAGFGVQRSSFSWLWAAAVSGVVAGAGLAWLTARYPAPMPFDMSKLHPWMIFVYFVLAAPIQEELIFRGLLQTTVARAGTSAGFRARHFPVIFVAGLFGVVHLDVGVLAATGAVLLGLIAGELRRTSGSLAPAILFHALLNGAQALWPAHWN